MALASWLLLLKTTEIHASYFLIIFLCLANKKNHPTVMQILKAQYVTMNT